ncbi:PepSY domain-containing protein [Arthrobacter sp. Marseille-P9274]|uniref:PepSY domain-containing protein n=1 Tax=Arthrobacter sp. Marseille-P9274 TaxID=2866572 RepID=UPI0021C7A529|nr:PepSY domain-containing protein [Arthrobacter sp. Marseille-P9274]
MTTVAFALGLALSMAACDSPEQGAPTTAGPTQTQMAPSATPGEGGAGGSPAAVGELNASAALLTALAAVRGGDAIDLDFRPGSQAWRVDVIGADTEYRLLVSPDGSEVLEQHPRAADPEHRSELQQAKIPMSEAITTGQQQAGGEISEVSLDDENGKIVWKVEVISTDGQRTEVLVDAVSGEALK